jgi:hypothetical protein
MNKITIAVVAAFLIYSLYSWYSIPKYDGFDINESVQVHAKPAPLVAPAPILVAPEPKQVLRPETAEEPYDPQEQPYESADHPDRLRRPERAYGPGLEQDDMRAVESGIASNSHEKTMNAYQTFGPEFAQNGASFMDGVMANDTALNDEYSSV